MSREATALTIIERGNAIMIASAADYVQAAEFLKNATALDRMIVSHYTPLKQQAHQLHAALVDAEKQQRTPVIAVINRVKGEILAWDEKQRQTAAAAQTQQQARINASVRPGTLAPQVQVAPEIPKVEGMSDRVTWSAVIDDADQIPREYCTPDLTKLNAAAKRMQAAFNIPGAHAVKDTNKIVKGL